MPVELPVMGYIKIGKRGYFQGNEKGDKEFIPPIRLPYIILTTMERDKTDNLIPDNALMEKMGAFHDDKTGFYMKEVPVRLMYNSIDLNIHAQRCAYEGRKVFCSGDGKKADRRDPQTGKFIEIDCPCPLADPDYNPRKPIPGKPKCFYYGQFQCVLDGADKVGGVYRFATKSFHSIKGLLASMQFYHNVTHGHIAGILFHLQIAPIDTEKGKVYVLRLFYHGSMEDLMKAGIERAQLTAGYAQEIQQIEAGVRETSSARIPEYDEAGVGDEFFPESSTQIIDEETGEIIETTKHEKKEVPPLAEPAKSSGKKAVKKQEEQKQEAKSEPEPEKEEQEESESKSTPAEEPENDDFF